MNIEEDIKNLKTYIELVIEKNYCECNELNTICYGKYGDGSKNVAKSIENVLTAYEKEKEKNKEILSGNIESFQKYFSEEFNKKFISMDKILEILGIEEETDSEKILSLLQTIVDENARLEDIEDKKVQIEYTNVFNKGVKSVKDKIKATIEDILNSENGEAIEKLIEWQSLLEKE